jgi:hypothetical protein
MMARCANDERWAQWRLIYADGTKRLLCSTCKDAELDALPSDAWPKVSFLGAVPERP